MSEKLVAEISSHTDDAIKGFFGPYRWLCNFHICPVKYAGLLYPSSENAYQAAKFAPKDRKRFQACSPRQAKIQGRTGDIDGGVAAWDGRKVDVMRAVLLDKFTRNKGLGQSLIETGDRLLEETNWWQDQFWGVCEGKGLNMLGKLLMTIREELGGSRFETW